jgi:hypothetical protein
VPPDDRPLSSAPATFEVGVIEVAVAGAVLAGVGLMTNIGSGELTIPDSPSGTAWWVDYLVKPLAQNGVRKLFDAFWNWVGAHWHEAVAWASVHSHEALTWVSSHWHEVVAWIIQLLTGGGSDQP